MADFSADGGLRFPVRTGRAGAGVSTPPVEPAPRVGTSAEAVGPEVVIRRRRYRRRHNKVRPGQVGIDPTLHAKASYFGWLFTGKKRH